MNKVFLCGRLCSDPEIRYYGETSTAYARFNLAVDRKFKKEGESSTDFIRIVTFGKSAEFAEKYFKKGTKIILSGKIQTSNYTGKDGNKVYSVEVIAEEFDFAESKASGEKPSQKTEKPSNNNEGFVKVEAEMDDDLPFN